MHLLPYIVALGAVIGATGVGFALRQFLNVGNLALVFISAITFVAARFGVAPSLFACAVASLAFNFFFLPPVYRLTIADPENVVALAFFLAVAVFVSNLAAQTRSEVFIARRRAKVTAELYSFSQKLAGIIDMDDLLWATAHQIASMLKVHVVILLPEEDRVVVRAGFPPEDELDASDLAAAKWSWDHDRPAGRGSDTLPGGRRLFLPLRTARGVVGVIGIDSEVPGPLFTPDERRLLEALLDQAAVSIERILLAEDVDKARIAAETERLRSSLLISVSHDLRTPLASILGAASSLKIYGNDYSQTTRDELLLTTIEEEAERLNRFVANLLDTTRLESGSLDIKRELTDVEEIVGSALQRAGKVLANHSISVDHDATLAEHIKKVISESCFTGEGYRKIWARLRFSGIRSSPGRVRRLMGENGLLAPHRVRKGPDKAHDGSITTEAVDVLWGTDMTQTITVAEGVAHVFVAVDHCNSECVGIHADKSANRFQALDPIRQGVRHHFGAIGKDVAAGLKLRHDHGPNYMSDDFQAEIAFLGIEPSPSFVRQPEGNGVAERFIRTLKENLLWVRHFDTVEALRLALLDFAAWYNTHWLVARHGHRTPAQIRADQQPPMDRAA